MRSFSKGSVAAITAAAMTIATFPIIVFSVLAASLIDEFAITRGQVGILVTATGLVGALVSPSFGRVTDRIGAVTATRMVLLIGIVTVAGLALAPSYLVLLAAAVATGIPNALIVDNIPAGARGVITGVKQSGVQIGTFLGGLLLPPLAALWGWRYAVGAFLAIPAGGLIALLGRKGSATTGAERRSGPRERVPSSVRWVALYGALSGMATSAMFGFLPLFAEEDQLWSAAAAGSLVAVTGLMGIVARIGWPHLSERRIGHGKTLRILASLSTVSALLLAAAALGLLGSWVLIPAAVLLGGGAIAWNAVGMLAVMDFSAPHMVGKGTGLVLLGFLLGLAGGAPMLGFSVDALGSYVPGWLASAGLLGACALIAGRIPAGSTLATP